MDLGGALQPAQQYIADLYAKRSNGGKNPMYVDGFHGSSLVDILQGAPVVDNEAFLSHTFHEITMYYPMKSLISGDYKLIWNVAYQLPYPHASDLWKSATWQATLKSVDQLYGKRTVDAYSFRDQFELYHLKNDPDEITNLANDKNSWEILESLKAKLKSLQTKTNDPWQSKWVHE